MNQKLKGQFAENCSKKEARRLRKEWEANNN